MANDSTLEHKQRLCKGCRNDFYNQAGNAMNGKHCWSLPDAQMVTRFRLHWWTAPTVPGAYTEVRVLDCYHQPGDFAYHKELPAFAVEARRLAVAR